MISRDQVETMRRDIERAWLTVDAVRNRNAEHDPDDVLRDVTEVVESVRQERYYRTAKAAPRRHRYQKDVELLASDASS